MDAEGSPGYDVGARLDDLVKVEANGEVHDEERSEKGLSGSAELLPKSAGSNPLPGTVNGDAIPKLNSTPGQSPASASVPNASASASSPPTVKGYGLRRWRRVKREVSKDDSSTDSSRILKRGLSISESAKILNANTQKSEQKDENLVAAVDSKGSQGLSNVHGIELELLEDVGSFSVGINSDDSDERSSTKANVEGLGHEKERDRFRNLRGRIPGGAAQSRGQRRKGAALQISKKIREDQAINSEKDDSYSSVESELRSSNAINEQPGSNGMQSEMPLNYDGPLDQNDSHAAEDIVEKLYGDQGEDHLQEGVSGKDTPTDQDGDPFAEPLNLLRAAQETLEKEIHILGEMGRDASARPNQEEAEATPSWAHESEKEMEELEALFRKSVEGEVSCLILSAAVREEARRAEREGAALLERRLEQVAESCRGLQRMEEVLRLHNGVWKFSLYWLAQLVLLLLAMAVLAAQVFFSLEDGGAVPT